MSNIVITESSEIKVYYATTQVFTFPVPTGVSASTTFKLAIREKRDPSLNAMAEATGTVADNTVTFSANTLNATFRDVSLNTAKVWLEVYADNVVFIQRQIEVFCRAGSVAGQPPEPITLYYTKTEVDALLAAKMPNVTGATTGQALIWGGTSWIPGEAGSGTVKSVNSTLPDAQGNVTLTAGSVGALSLTGGAIDGSVTISERLTVDILNVGDSGISTGGNADLYSITSTEITTDNLTVGEDGGLTVNGFMKLTAGTAGKYLRIASDGQTVEFADVQGGVTSVNGGTGSVVISVNGQTTTNITLDASSVGALSLTGGTLQDATIAGPVTMGDESSISGDVSVDGTVNSTGANTNTLVVNEGSTFYGDMTAGNVDLQGLTASSVPDVVNVGATFTPSVLGHYAGTVSNGETIHIVAPETGKTIFDYDLTVAAGTTSFVFDPPVYWTGLGGTVSFNPGSTVNLRLEYVGGTFQGGYRDPDLSQYPTLSGTNVFTGGNTFNNGITFTAGTTQFNYVIGQNVGGDYGRYFSRFVGWKQFYNENCFYGTVQYNNANVNAKGGFVASDATTGNITSPGDVIATISGSTVAMSELEKSPLIVDGGTASDVTVAISGGTKYKYATLSGLTFSTVANSEKEAVIIFTSGATATTLDTPSTVLWQGGELPSIEANMTYAISIQNNLAVCAGFAEVTE